MKRLVIFAVVIVLIGGFAARTQAGGWATVRLDEDPETPVVGQEWTVTFMVKQHDVTPVDLDNVYLAAQQMETGEMVSTEATKLPEIGRYSVTTTFPSAGQWQWSITPDGFAATTFPVLEVVESPEEAKNARYSPRQAAIMQDQCVTPGKVYQTLPDAIFSIVGSGEEESASTWLGSTSAEPVLSSRTTIPVVLEWLAQSYYSVAVSQDGETVACGDIGGQVNDGELVLGIKPTEGSQTSGVAVLTADGATTVFSLYLIQGEKTVSPPAAQMTPTQIVRMTGTDGNWTFSPSVIEIKAGTTVTWINETEATHTVSSENIQFASSGWFDPKGSFSETFTTPGTFEYYCWPHRQMIGEIVVTE